MPKYKCLIFRVLCFWHGLCLWIRAKRARARKYKQGITNTQKFIKMKTLNQFRNETSETEIFRLFNMVKDNYEKIYFLSVWRGDMEQITKFVYYIYLRDDYFDLCDDRENLSDDMFYFQINERFDDWENAARKYERVCKKIAKYYNILSNYFTGKQLIY